jgi:hypothetical protein
VKFLSRLFLTTALTLAPMIAHAVYAPIPLLEQGKPFTIYLGAGLYYDTNIFGAEANAVDSMVYQFAPNVVFNASLSKQTFLSANYRLSLDYMPDRPGEKLLDSHEFTGRFAHTVSPQTEFDISDSFQMTKNPESLLPGFGTVNTDQSLLRNQLDGRLSTSFTRRNGVLLKARWTTFDYEREVLAEQLNRQEFLAGITVVRATLPTLKTSAEYRFQAIRYDTAGYYKDKTSHFLLAGGDYALNDRFAVSARIGAEFRSRKSDRDVISPYVELGVKRDYAKGSFVSVGYSHSVEETSNVQLFTDAEVHRLFLNWQHVITPKLLATSAVNWEPSVLKGRRGVSSDRDETNLRVGTALVFRASELLSFTANVDLDRIRSDQPGRDLKRERLGISAKYAF